MAKSTPKDCLGKLQLATIIISIIVLGLVALSWWCDSYYQQHFLPQTVIGSLDISRLTPEQAAQKASQIWDLSPDTDLVITVGDAYFATPSSSLQFYYDTKQTIADLFDQQQHLSMFTRWHYLLSDGHFYLESVPLSSNNDLIEGFLQQIDEAITQKGHHPQVQIQQEQIIIDPGQQEISLNRQQTLADIKRLFPTQSQIEATLNISPEYSPLTPAQTQTLEQQARKLISKSIVLTTDSLDRYSGSIADRVLIPLLIPDSPAKSAYLQQVFAQVDTVVSRPPQEPVLEIDDDTHKVTTFTPPHDGLTLDQNSFEALLLADIQTLLSSDNNTINLELPLVVTPPTHSLGEINNYGIKEIIGFGESYYAHSSSGRIHNVAVAASRVNGTLVAPGEEFSFNKAVGDVSAASGYQPGYIIQGGRSVLSAGGGVCQVSTTVFRALLDSGLQITLRRPHSYRVTYYELNNDPGFDATVYAGNVDLRFINDTDNYVLITATTDSTNLYMYVQLWGTSDGRRAEITDYKKFNAVGAPPPQYITDPSLAPGQIKQIDWAVGGLQTTFTHTVYNADGSVRSQKEYPSKYQAWSSKYLVGPSE
ncbi:VanW family protein [bacterium]|nr:VanW family protein [bacterium]